MDEIDEILSAVPEGPVDVELSTADVGLDAAVDEMFTAVETGDRESFKSALKSAFELLSESRSPEALALDV